MTGRASSAGAARLVALAAILVAACRGAPESAEKPGGDADVLAIVPATFALSSARAPLQLTRTQRRATVPPGVLSRAAEARALERTPACPTPPPAAPATDLRACAAEPHATVQIDWDGAPGE